jgi:hypothetical protein
VRQPFPATPNADDVATDFADPIHYGLDDGIQPGYVSAPGKNANSLRSHECSFYEGI